MLRQENRDGLLVLTLARPQRLNALTPELLRELRDALRGAVILL